MTDLSTTIAPKSSQLNADDLIAGPRTIKVAKVYASTEPNQPIAINFEGDNGKPYYPCKIMRRALVQLWGKDGGGYVGKSMTLYRDPKVLFGGIAVGGIRISHVSDIAADVTMAVTESKSSRRPFVVRPLVDDALEARALAAAELGSDAAREFFKGLTKAQDDALTDSMRTLKAVAKKADDAAAKRAQDTAAAAPPAEATTASETTEQTPSPALAKLHQWLSDCTCTDDIDTLMRSSGTTSRVEQLSAEERAQWDKDVVAARFEFTRKVA